MKSILDRSFRYVPSAETDLRKTFARVRREQRHISAGATDIAPRAGKVTPLQHDSRQNAIKRFAPGKL